MDHGEEEREENRKIRYLRYLVDFSIRSIQEENLSFEEAMGIVMDARRAACGLSPGKELVFDLIYRPRFYRVIRQRTDGEAGGGFSFDCHDPCALRDLLAESNGLASHSHLRSRMI